MSKYSNQNHQQAENYSDIPGYKKSVFKKTFMKAKQKLLAKSHND